MHVPGPSYLWTLVTFWAVESCHPKHRHVPTLSSLIPSQFHKHHQPNTSLVKSCISDSVSVTHHPLICLRIYPSTHLSCHPSIHPPVYRSIYLPPIPPPTHPSTQLSMHNLPVHQSTNAPINPSSTHQYTHLSTHLPSHPSTYPTTHLPIHPLICVINIYHMLTMDNTLFWDFRNTKKV